MTPELESDEDESLNLPSDVSEDSDAKETSQRPANGFKCVICNEKFKSKDEYQEHKETHLTFKCDECDKRYFKAAYLKKHLKNAHLKSKNLKCPICSNTFKAVYNLKQHLFTHSNERNYVCSYESCNKQFRQISSLQAHEKIHNQENKKECPQCKRQVARLKEHMRTHLPDEEKPLKCDQCDKKFATQIKLEEHLNIHKDLKPFECTICCKNFNRRSTLYKHKKIHTNQKFTCSQCNKNYSRKDYLQQHIKKAHTDK